MGFPASKIFKTLQAIVQQRATRIGLSGLSFLNRVGNVESSPGINVPLRRALNKGQRVSMSNIFKTIGFEREGIFSTRVKSTGKPSLLEASLGLLITLAFVIGYAALVIFINSLIY